MVENDQGLDDKIARRGTWRLAVAAKPMQSQEYGVL